MNFLKGIKFISSTVFSFPNIYQNLNTNEVKSSRWTRGKVEKSCIFSKLVRNNRN